MNDLISRQAVIDMLAAMQGRCTSRAALIQNSKIWQQIKDLPPAKPEYEPVEAEDFAKTMSENTLYGFMAWHSEALELMERHGFVICKKTM